MKKEVGKGSSLKRLASAPAYEQVRNVFFFSFALDRGGGGGGETNISPRREGLAGVSCPSYPGVRAATGNQKGAQKWAC
jgi:hypothetical protein